MAPHKGLNINIIIDGQQRLTTIYILLKALTDKAQNEAERVTASGYLFNKDEFNQLQLDETTKMKLKPAKGNNEQLINLIYGNSENIDYDCEIYQNYKFFCDLIEEEQSKGITVSDIYRGVTLLTVAVIQLDSNDNAQEIFENINSTGVLLNLEDKIRKDLLKIVDILSSKGITLISNKENFDTSTPTGKLMLTMIGAINEFERTNLLERQKEGIEIAKRNGKYKGRKPIKIENFDELYRQYQKREINKTELSKKLGVSRPTLDKLIREYKEKNALG